jgi:hypothetical protein
MKYKVHYNKFGINFQKIITLKTSIQFLTSRTNRIQGKLIPHIQIFPINIILLERPKHFNKILLTKVDPQYVISFAKRENKIIIVSTIRTISAVTRKILIDFLQSKRVDGFLKKLGSFTLSEDFLSNESPFLNLETFRFSVEMAESSLNCYL